MIINADLHIHGRYSIATSKNMIPPIMAPQARLKGLDLVATGDALHQKWLNLLEDTIEESSDGIFSLKDSVRNPEDTDDQLSKFILTTEVEDIKRVHHLIIFPSIESAWDTRTRMKGNMDADGRPRVRMNGSEIMDIAHDNGCIIGPAHAFTPWTSIYKEYDNINDCYGKMPDFL
ncbi:MAG: phosphotransferase, partial [Methanobacterium sp.]